MKLEDQVVSLELAKKLKELGVKQESAFIWLNTNHGTECVLEPNVDRWYDGQWRTGWSVECSAFTVAELGEMLPKLLEGEYGTMELVWKHDTIGYGTYQFECLWHDIQIEPDCTEADARAKMLIYLIENNLVTI